MKVALNTFLRSLQEFHDTPVRQHWLTGTRQRKVRGKRKSLRFNYLSTANPRKVKRFLRRRNAEND